MHDEQLLAKATLLQGFLEIAQVAVDQRLHVGIGHGRAGALVLAEFRGDGGRDGHRDAGRTGGDPLADGPLVLGASVGMQQRDGDGLAPGCDHGVDRAIDGCQFERPHHGSIRPHAFRNLGNMATLHERLGLVDVEIIGLVALLTANDQDITKPIGGDEARWRPLALEHRVGRDRRCMQHHVDRTAWDAHRLQQLLQARDHGLAGIVGCCRDFEDVRCTGCAVAEDEIGEGAADVECHTDHAGLPRAIDNWSDQLH